MGLRHLWCLHLGAALGIATRDRDKLVRMRRNRRRRLELPAVGNSAHATGRQGRNGTYDLYRTQATVRNPIIRRLRQPYSRWCSGTPTTVRLRGLRETANARKQSRPETPTEGLNSFGAQAFQCARRNVLHPFCEQPESADFSGRFEFA